MADDDEIDVLGDFSFNSCFAQNNQGIPSCSNREDTVHPQWLLDSTATNWYDTHNKDKIRFKEGSFRKLSGNTKLMTGSKENTSWSEEERLILKKEMMKHGRNVNIIAQTLKTKTESDIQALIEAEYGIHLDTARSATALSSYTTNVEETVVNMNDVLSIMKTGTPTIPIPKNHPSYNNMSYSLSKGDSTDILVNSSEIYYEDDLIVGSIESVGPESDVTVNIKKSSIKKQKECVKVMKKLGNHRRKVSKIHKGKFRNKSKDNLKSPQSNQRIESSVSDSSTKSSKIHIMLGSGQALTVSKGEEIIKIEKKKDSECESDIEVDIDGESEASQKTEQNLNKLNSISKEAPVAVALRKFEPMPKRNRKINLDGGGGYTIMHTESGDLYEIGQEPRKERVQKKPAIELIPCRFYNSEKPAPFLVQLNVSALILMDVHAHMSRGEVAGLVGGEWRSDALIDEVGGEWGAVSSPGEAGGEPRRNTLRLQRYRRTTTISAAITHCEMDPVSQAAACEWLSERRARVCAWHHSHPRFPPAPSACDLRSQRALQRLRGRAPLVALVSSQAWPPGRRASLLKCFRTEDDGESDLPIGYQLNLKLVPDLAADSLPELVCELREMLLDEDCRSSLSVNMAADVCPLAGLTYLDKCISSIRHHMHSAGYRDDDPVIEELVQGLRDILR